MGITDRRIAVTVIYRTIKNGRHRNHTIAMPAGKEEYLQCRFFQTVSNN